MWNRRRNRPITLALAHTRLQVYVYLKSKVNEQDDLEMSEVFEYVSERIPGWCAVCSARNSARTSAV